jgi:hypothetical protein
VPHNFPRQEPPKPDWELWSHKVKACLWEAVAISLDIEPGSSPNQMPARDKRVEYTRRFRLAEEQLGAALPVVVPPSKADNRDPAYTLLRLDDFAAFAKRQQPEWALPPRFPAPSIRPDWRHWLQMAYVHLAEAVALSFDIEPKTINVNTHDGPGYQSRKEIADSHWVAGTLPHARGYQGEEVGGPHRYVHLSEFARWFVDLDPPMRPPLPPQFPQAAKAPEPKADETTQPEKAPTNAKPIPPKPATADAEVGTELGKGARESLLTILAIAMGDEKLAKPASEAGKIERRLVLMGIDKPKKRMILNYLKEAKTLLDQRRTKTKGGE